MENGLKIKGLIGAGQYIETVYGTKTFARALVLDDAQSIMDLMDDFAVFNLQKVKINQLVAMLTDVKDYLGSDKRVEVEQLIKEIVEDEK